MAKKCVGWAMTSTGLSGQKYITIVSAKSKSDAIAKFEALYYKISDAEQVRHVCIVKYPGPADVKKLKPVRWDKAIRPIEDKGNG